MATPTTAKAILFTLYPLIRRLDLVLADDVAPACDLALEELLRGLGRALVLRIGEHAARHPALHGRRIVEQRLQRAVQLLDYRARRSRRREERVPVLDLELRPVQLDEAGGAGKLRVGLSCRDAVGLELPRVDQRQHRLR